MKRVVLTAMAGIAAFTMSTQAAAQGRCPRESLDAAADSWIAAVAEGNPFKMQLGEWVDYRENMKLGTMSSFFTEPREIAHTMKLLDTTTCQVFVEMVIPEGTRPMVLATQIGQGFFGLGPIKNIISEKGDWLFDPVATARYAKLEDWDLIPEDQRDSREVLKAAADAYLDLFMDKSVEVPWGEPCARLEGGIYTGRNQPTDTCNVGVPENVPMVEREYVIDEAKGAVNVFLKMGENKRPDSHTFRIEDGKLRYVHTVTNCGDQENCGFPPLEEMLKNNPDMQPDIGG